MAEFRNFLVGGTALGAIAASIANLKADTASGEQGGVGPWLISLLILGVVAAIVYFVVARMLRGGPTRRPTAALVFAVLGVLGLVAFWAGISGVFAGAAVGLALPGSTTDERQGASEAAAIGGLSIAAIVLAVVVAVALIFGAITG